MATTTLGDGYSVKQLFQCQCDAWLRRVREGGT